MRFGLLLDHQYPAGEDLGAKLEELVDLTRLARDLGYDSIFGIQHYLASLRTPQPLLVLARLVDHSGDMRLGTGIYVATLTHPVQVAEETATLDQLSGGRLVLGVGAGYRANEFAAFGIDPTTRGPRLVETIELVRSLWSGETVHHDGRFFHVDGERACVLPVQRPGPPVWVGANAEKTIRRAARIGDAWLASPNVKPRWAAGHLDHFRDEAAAVGRDPDTLEAPILRELYIADTDEEATRDVEAYLRDEYLAYSAYDLDYFRDMFDDLRRKAFLVGSPDTVAEKVEELREGGFTTIIFRTFWSGMPHRMARRTVERFAAEVMPRFTRAS